MKKRIIAIILLLALSAVAFSACAKESFEFTDKLYIFERLEGEGAFTIRINADGTFQYNEGTSESSYIVGVWSYDDSVLCLTNSEDEEAVIQNRFEIGDNCLIFISEESSNFENVTVEDGEKFIAVSVN